ncbi:hypothetical protein AZZ70_000874, partial [Klebsiella pneumoniae]
FNPYTRSLLIYEFKFSFCGNLLIFTMSSLHFGLTL